MVQSDSYKTLCSPYNHKGIYSTSLKPLFPGVQLSMNITKNAYHNNIKDVPCEKNIYDEHVKILIICQN